MIWTITDGVSGEFLEYYHILLDKNYSGFFSRWRKRLRRRDAQEIGLMLHNLAMLSIVGPYEIRRGVRERRADIIDYIFERFPKTKYRDLDPSWELERNLKAAVL